jgi:alkylation response protein AidB-like acyl-CoA dehydrogenase
MDLTLGADQEAIRDAIRAVLRERFDAARLRAVLERDDRFDASLWQTGAELGWLGLALPEEAGGAGYGLPEAMLLFVEIGRALATGPWLGNVVAGAALSETGDRSEVAEIAAGRRRVALVDDPEGRWRGNGAPLVDVVDGPLANAVLVLGPTQVTYSAVRGSDAGEGVFCMDPTRRLGAMTLDAETTRTLDGASGVRATATVLVAAELAGIAERTTELSVDFAKVREQFGRPIGTFQAIKHRCADMAVRAEVARSVVTYAAVALHEAAADAPLFVHAAKTLATDAAIANATDNVQNHGGMGYTWESDAHLYLKRARLMEHVLGTRAAHLDAIASPWRRDD